MLTVLIETRNHEEALARTLASLVGGAVDGTIREVIICDQGSSDGTHKVADHSGCTFLDSSDLAKGIAQSRSEWLLILQPGARLLDGWTDEVRDHAAHERRPARFLRSKASRGSFWARILQSRGLGEGLLISRQDALEKLRGGAKPERLVKGARRLAAEIITAG